jgi:transcription elongation factor GreA
VNILAGAVIIKGCRVTVEDLDSGEQEEYIIVGSQEANPLEFRISDESPIGQALIGKEAGDEITVDVPVGKLRYRIIEITA